VAAVSERIKYFITFFVPGGVGISNAQWYVRS